MIKCRKCGAPCAEGSLTCPECGAALQSENPFEGNVNPYTAAAQSAAPAEPQAAADAYPSAAAPAGAYTARQPAHNPFAQPANFGQTAQPVGGEMPGSAYNTAYGAPDAPGTKYFREDAPVTGAQWALLIGMNLIPIAGSFIFIILMIVFAVGGTKNRALVNFARAFFVVAAVCTVIGMLLSVFDADSVLSASGSTAHLVPMLFTHCKGVSL